ncbi:MAG: aryl-sulfate sulfotransferase [Bacteroidia bacterium]|nr:aryl-sulfate sulfotransferase [Bacteroidia bacterium]
MKKIILFFCLAGVFLQSAFPQDQTVGLFTYDTAAYDGYTLFAPLRSKTAFLIDNCGRLINQWVNDKVPGNTVIFTPTGHLLRSEMIPNPVMNVGGMGGRVEKVDWDGNIVWEFTYSDSSVAHHHEALMLPNGNVLLLALERRPIAEAFARGRNPANTNVDEFWPEQIVEIQPIGTDSGAVVWEWHIWDHLIQDFDSTKADYGNIADHPELLDINFTFSAFAEDWLHANAIDYNAERDEIILSLRNTNEFYIIDHSTTSAEAAGHTGGNRGKGGDFLYRWGNPMVYDRGTEADQQLFGQHHVHWVEEGSPDYGKILAFNNGALRPDSNYASIDLINPPLDSAGNYVLSGTNAWGPDSAEWALTVDIPMKYPAGFLGSSQQLPNKNLLICHGPDGILYEVDSTGQLVWHYVIPVGQNGPYNQGGSVSNASANSLDTRTFRCIRYPKNYPGLAGISLSLGDRIEGNPLPLPVNCNTDGLEDLLWETARIFPNPAGEKIAIQLDDSRRQIYRIRNLHGQAVLEGEYQEGNFIDISRLSPGVYLLEVWASEDTFPKVGKFVRQ